MSKPLWRILLFSLAALALWRSVDAGLCLWKYNRLGREVSAEVEGWEAVPKGAKYALEASYSYTCRGKDFIGTTLFSKPYYLNKGAAERAIQRMSGMEWVAWVDSNKPGYSSLERSYPLKKLVYASCVLGIFLYFLYMKFHLELLSRSM